MAPPDPWGIADELRALRAEVRTLRDELAELRQTGSPSGSDPFLDSAQAAALAGRTRAAWKRLRQRHPEIDARSVGDGKARRWPRSVVVEIVRAGGLRTIGGGSNT